MTTQRTNKQEQSDLLMSMMGSILTFVWVETKQRLFKGHGG